MHPLPVSQGWLQSPSTYSRLLPLSLYFESFDKEPTTSWWVPHHGSTSPRLPAHHGFGLPGCLWPGSSSARAPHCSQVGSSGFLSTGTWIGWRSSDSLCPLLAFLVCRLSQTDISGRVLWHLLCCNSAVSPQLPLFRAGTTSPGSTAANPDQALGPEVQHGAPVLCSVPFST